MQLSSFFVRTVRPNRATNQGPPRTTLLLDPPRVDFYNYPSTEISLAKIVLKNQSRFLKKISIGQPSKNYFQVKCASKEIAGKEQVDIFVRFNPQREKANIEDQFLIKIENEATELHVPIYCQYRTDFASRFSSSKNLIASKEMDKNPVIKESFKRNFKYKESRINLRNPSIVRNIIEQAHAVYIRESAVQQFQTHFKRVSEYVREKYVKNEVYLGEVQLLSAKQQQIRQYAEMTAKVALNRLLELVRARYQVQYCEEGPAIKPFDSVTLGWDTGKNNPALTFEWGMCKMHEEVRKYVVSLRFQKIQKSLRIYREYHQRETDKNKRLKVDQYIEYINCRKEDSSFFIDYELEFDKATIKSTHLPTPNDICFPDYQFEIIQRIGFDNWLPMNVVAHHHQQLYLLDDIDIPLGYVYLPPGPAQGRKGAPQQLVFKQPSNCIVQISPLKQSAEQWKQEKQTIMDQDCYNHLYFQCQNCIGMEQNQLSQQQEWLSLSPISQERWPWSVRQGSQNLLP